MDVRAVCLEESFPAALLARHGAEHAEPAASAAAPAPPSSAASTCTGATCPPSPAREVDSPCKVACGKRKADNLATLETPTVRVRRAGSAVLCCEVHVPCIGPRAVPVTPQRATNTLLPWPHLQPRKLAVVTPACSSELTTL